MENSQSLGKPITTAKKPFALMDKFLSFKNTFEIIVKFSFFTLDTLFIKNKMTQISIGSTSTYLLFGSLNICLFPQLVLAFCFLSAKLRTILFPPNKNEEILAKKFLCKFSKKYLVVSNLKGNFALQTIT
jgi:hypothetical protein